MKKFSGIQGAWLLGAALALLAVAGHARADEEEDAFFALPSPNEILSASENQGLKITVSEKEARVIGTNLSELAKKDPQRACFIMGRIFAISGFKFKELNNAVLLSLAQKIYDGIKGLELPEALQSEINRQYVKMIANPKWERGELMLAFTSARSSLMFLLKDTKKLDEATRNRVEDLGLMLELGIWFESLHLATLSVRPPQDLTAFHTVYFMEDVLTYFGGAIAKILKREGEKPHYLSLKAANDRAVAVAKDGKVEAAEVEQMKELLQKVME